MFVVMAIGASEAEILGVKSQILAEGLSPYDHAGAERVVIAVVGEVGPKAGARAGSPRSRGSSRSPRSAGRSSSPRASSTPRTR